MKLAHSDLLNHLWITDMHIKQTALLCCADMILHQLTIDRMPQFDWIFFDGLSETTNSIQHRPIFCFVDWLLPEISGLALCRRLRDMSVTRNAHIIIAIEQNDNDARRRALKAGADDYLTGPLTIDKMIERLALPRKNFESAVIPPVSHGEIEIDNAAFLVRYRGKRLSLPPNEFRLLAHFVQHPDRAFSRSSLIAIVGKDKEAIDDRTVDVWIGRLRKTLKQNGVPDPIRSVRSIGYVFDGTGPMLQ